MADVFNVNFVLQRRRMYIPLIAHDLFSEDQLEKINQVMAVLEALELVAQRTDYAEGFEYVGPDIDREVRSELFGERQQEFGLKPCSITLKNHTFSDSMPLPKIRKRPEFKPKFKRKSWDPEKIALEKERSLANAKITCKCGHQNTLKPGSSSRSKAHAGFKKRVRCYNCEPCKAPKCGQCAPCLKPALKKPCTNKICLYPVVPKCPCFM